MLIGDGAERACTVVLFPPPSVAHETHCDHEPSRNFPAQQEGALFDTNRRQFITELGGAAAIVLCPCRFSVRSSTCLSFPKRKN
jgi:hypothetical protein